MHVEKEFALEKKVSNMNVFGDLLIATSNDSILKLNLETGNKEEVEIGHPIDFIFHPSFYLNKVLISHDETLELWNIKTHKLIYTF